MDLIYHVIDSKIYTYHSLEYIPYRAGLLLIPSIHGPIPILDLFKFGLSFLLWSLFNLTLINPGPRRTLISNPLYIINQKQKGGGTCVNLSN